MKKRILKLLLSLVVLLVILAAVGWFLLDPLTTKGIEGGAKYALGVDTSAEGVHVGVMDGQLTIKSLTLGNPEGFESSHLMQTGLFDVQIRPRTLLSDPIEIDHFTLDGLDLNIERKGGSNNISAVMDYAEKKLGGGEAKPEEKPKDDEAGRKVSVDRITIKNVVAHVHLGGPMGDHAMTIELPAIEMTGVTSDNAGGIAMAELTRRILAAIMAGVVEKGKGILPADLAGAIKGNLANVQATLGQGAGNLLEQARTQGGNLGEQAGKLGGQVTEQVGKLGGLLKPKSADGDSSETNGEANTDSGDSSSTDSSKSGGVLDKLFGGKKD